MLARAGDSGNKDGPWEFDFRLNIEDATAAAEVLVRGEEASQFFGGTPGRDLSLPSSCRAALERLMQEICNCGDDQR